MISLLLVPLPLMHSMSELTYKPAGIASKQALIQRLFYQVSAEHNLKLFLAAADSAAVPIRLRFPFYRF